MLRCLHLAAAACLLGAPAAAGQAPDTDIFLADLTVVAGRATVGTPVNLTARTGYDNQPWFLRDGSGLLYTSERDGQTEVFRYDFETGRAARLTTTPENEYSPTLTEDGATMLVVRWAPDMSDGRLWRYSAAGEALAEAAGSVPRIGYYAVVDSSTFAIFVNDSVQSFLLTDRRTGAVTRIGQDLGGSPPVAIPGRREVSFFRRGAADAWWIDRLDIDTGRTEPIVQAVPGNAHYAWTPDGTLLMAGGATLHAFKPGADTEWRVLAEFEDPDLGAISRIAISPTGDRIALVSLSAAARRERDAAR
jgi:dipeptidyl aminopeptidase/acylaminoacyl peptidase